MFPCPRSKGEASRPPSQPTDCQRVTASHGESPWYEGRRGLAWELSEQRRGTCPRKQTELGFCIIAPRLTYFLMSLVTLTSSTPSGHKRHPWGPCPRLRTHSRGQRGRKRQTGVAHPGAAKARRVQRPRRRDEGQLGQPRSRPSFKSLVGKLAVTQPGVRGTQGPHSQGLAQEAGQGHPDQQSGRQGPGTSQLNPLSVALCKGFV